jgi:hypothetical protein
MMLMPAVGYENVMNFNWPELKGWHEIAVKTFKSIRGVD